MASSRKTPIILGTLLALGVGLAWWAYGQVGKTPGELMDYIERRLQGHSKIEWVALPVLAQVRTLLDQPSIQTLLQTPFVIPALPPLVKSPAAVSTAARLPFHPSSPGRILSVGPFEDIRTIAQASKVAKDGDTVEIQAGEYHGDVALWGQKKLTIRTRGGVARLFSDGKNAEGKAIWVIRNGDFEIENIDFVGTHVGDNNGAGIRFEGGNLHIKNCLFYANDTGLLTTAEAETLTIEQSEFAYNGFGDGQSHNLYVGAIRSLKLIGNYFHHANVGHLVKSRAKENHIYYNRITDESGGRASYEIDLPNGGVAYIVGNILQQDVVPQNSTMIAYGMEGLAWPENRLYVASNTIVNDHPYGGTFARTAQGTQRFLSANNIFVGPGKFHTGTVDAESFNDIRAGWELFTQASRYNYHLNSEGKKLDIQLPVMPELRPNKQYVSDRRIIHLNRPPQYVGAMQIEP